MREGSRLVGHAVRLAVILDGSRCAGWVRSVPIRRRSEGSSRARVRVGLHAVRGEALRSVQVSYLVQGDALLRPMGSAPVSRSGRTRYVGCV